jgi:virulence-associated protein VagC
MSGSEAEKGGAAPPRRAKLFWNGRSQAVRLPKDFRFPGDAVEIRREGNAVILEPVKEAEWPEGYWEWVARRQTDMDIGDVEHLAVGLLEVGLDDA